MFIYYNPNPDGKSTNDDTVRALAKLLDFKWECAYFLLCYTAIDLFEMPTSHAVLGKILFGTGYRKRVVADSKGYDYTVKDFCRENPNGKFAVITNTHVIPIVDGKYYDNLDSGEETPLYFWKL